MVKVEKLKAKGDIPRLVELLFSKKEKKRLASCEALVSMGPKVTPHLITVLGERLNPSRARITAVRALGLLRDPASVPPLIQGLLEEEAISDMCSQALINIGSAAVPNLLDAIHQGSRQTPAVVIVLGKIRDPSAIQTVVSILSHRDPEVRKASVAALGELGDSRVAPMLVPFLRDVDGEIRKEAVLSLGQLKFYDSLPYLEKLLFDEVETVREAARRSIDHITQLL